MERVCVCVTINFNIFGPLSPSLSPGSTLPPCDSLTLVSQVTGALQPLNATVHHLHSAGGDTSTTVSRLLLGLPQPVPVARVSTALDSMVKRVYEVIGVRVQGGASVGVPWGCGAGTAGVRNHPAGEGWPDPSLAHPGPKSELQVLKPECRELVLLRCRFSFPALSPPQPLRPSFSFPPGGARGHILEQRRHDLSPQLPNSPPASSPASPRASLHPEGSVGRICTKLSLAKPTDVFLEEITWSFFSFHF